MITRVNERRHLANELGYSSFLTLLAACKLKKKDIPAALAPF